MKTTDPVIKFILTSKRYEVTLGKTLTQIIDNMAKTEVILMSQWNENKWYIEVRNNSMYAKALSPEDYIRSIRFCLSVESDTGEIMWNWDGGNCMARGKKWQKFVEKQYPTEYKDNEYVDLGRRLKDRKHIHIYK